jgi:hypothetical protein
VARAKRTARAEARRRYRADHPQAASEFESEDGEAGGATPDEEPAARRGTPTRSSGAPSGPGGRPVRMSALGAFRAAYQPADFRGDLKALPELIRSRAVTIPLLLVLISTVVLVIAVQTSATPAVSAPGASGAPTPSATLVATPAPSSSAVAGASASPAPSGATTGTAGTVSGSPLGIVASIMALLFLGIPSPPAIGGIYLAAILAKRSSYLAGGIAGLAGSTGALGAVIFLSPQDAAETTALFGQILVTSVLFGIVIGAGLGYYRRLLRLMNPTPNRPTNRSKQPARRR